MVPQSSSKLRRLLLLLADSPNHLNKVAMHRLQLPCKQMEQLAK
jgi:hypothetical protein